MLYKDVEFNSKILIIAEGKTPLMDRLVEELHPGYLVLLMIFVVGGKFVHEYIKNITTRNEENEARIFDMSLEQTQLGREINQSLEDIQDRLAEIQKTAKYRE